MLTVHHLADSRSQRILWLLEELQVPYEIRRYERAADKFAPPELRQIHPLGKAPIITDGDITVAESGAIIQYLVEYYGEGRLIPEPRTAQRRRFDYWLHYAEGSLMPLLVMSLVMARVERAPMPFIARPVAKQITAGVQNTFLGPQLKLHLDHVEQSLAGSVWFAGDEFTAADVQMSFPLEAGATRGKALEDRPHIAAFLQRIHARPAYQRALERGGPYAYVE